MLRASRFIAAALAATLLSVGNAAWAEPTTWTIDPNHSQVGFSIRHFFAKVPGSFQRLAGSITFDPENVPASSVEVTIEAASIDTGVDRRDEDLRSANFFDVEKFPTITYASTKVTSTEQGKLKVEGNLTMHGVTKPVTLDVSFLGSGPGGREGERRAGFEASTSLNRKDYGIIWNRTLDLGALMLGDDVAIAISIEGYAR